MMDARRANTYEGEEIITQKDIDKIKVLAQHISVLSKHGVITITIRKDKVDEMEMTAFLKSGHQL